MVEKCPTPNFVNSPDASGVGRGFEEAKGGDNTTTFRGAKWMPNKQWQSTPFKPVVAA